MDLGIEKISVNGVFGRRMEMELLRREVGLAFVGERDHEFGVITLLILRKDELLGVVRITIACFNKIIVVIANNFHLI